MEDNSWRRFENVLGYYRHPARVGTVDSRSICLSCIFEWVLLKRS